MSRQSVAAPSPHTILFSLHDVLAEPHNPRHGSLHGIGSEHAWGQASAALHSHAMLKFNKSTMIGLYAMVELARDPLETLSAGEIAARFHASRHHLVKVLQQLVRGGLVESVRGAAGGHRLTRDPRDVTLSDIVEIFEGPRQEGRLCLLMDPEAEFGDPTHCVLHPVFSELYSLPELTASLVQNLRASPTAASAAKTVRLTSATRSFGTVDPPPSTLARRVRASKRLQLLRGDGGVPHCSASTDIFLVGAQWVFPASSCWAQLCTSGFCSCLSSASSLL